MYRCMQQENHEKEEIEQKKIKDMQRNEYVQAYKQLNHEKRTKEGNGQEENQISTSV